MSMQKKLRRRRKKCLTSAGGRVYNNAIKPMSGESNQKGMGKESRRWWECGVRSFGEWSREGEPNRRKAQ